MRTFTPPGGRHWEPGLFKSSPHCNSWNIPVQQGLAPFADAAATMFAEGAKVKPTPYDGYYFHILKAQGPDAPGGSRSYVVKGMMMGGFALVAFPADYAVSGATPFIVNHQGVVYEKDLGTGTMMLARQITRFNPDKTWRKIEGE